MKESIENSCGINGSRGINGSNGINGSRGINGSNGINGSFGINRSDGINGSFGINGSDGINGSCGINGSNGINGSFGINGSCGINGSNGINNSFFVNDVKRSPILFNKASSEERIEEVRERLYNLWNGWRPTFHNIKSLYLKHGSEWLKTPVEKAEELTIKEAWDGMPEKSIEYLKSIPEFDAEIFLKITGIDVTEKPEEMVEIDGKQISKSTVKQALKQFMDGL